MPIVQTDLLKQGELRGDTLQVYNGLDCCLTFEVLEEMMSLGEPPPVYQFERALQGPILEIMLRGFKVDNVERQAGITRLRRQQARLDSILQRFAWSVWGKPLNPRSHHQLKDFFYTYLGLPEVWINDKGVRRISVNREALEKIEVYFHARPLVACILAYRDTAKRLEVLETEVDYDGRMRTSYNIAGTETGRLSSSASAEGRGTNLQNITPELRTIFVADAGWKLCVIDLEQAESREVGWLLWVLFGDARYLDACETGDLHTYTSRLIWPSLGWTGDPKKDRAIADGAFYRHFSYRDMAKRGGHGTTYYGTPWTMSRHLKVPVRLMEDFQFAFFSAFPSIPRWHRWTAQEIQTKQELTTAFGFTRHFFGRPNDDSTLREGIAFSPQSSTAHRTNLGLLRHWQRFKTQTQLLAQTHDSITFQYREEDEEAIIPEALKLMEVSFEHRGRTFSIPGEAKVGWNWGNHHREDKPYGPGNRNNPNGLRKWRGKDTRRRLGRLDLPLPSLH